MKLKIQVFALIGGVVVAAGIYLIRRSFTHTFDELTKHRWM